MVDLDGAKDGERIHDKDVIRAATELGVNVQIGGGIRTEEDVNIIWIMVWHELLLEAWLFEQPELAVSMIQKFGAEKIVIGLDAKDGMVATHGWLETSKNPRLK